MGVLLLAGDCGLRGAHLVVVGGYGLAVLACVGVERTVGLLVEVELLAYLQPRVLPEQRVVGRGDAGRADVGVGGGEVKPWRPSLWGGGLGGVVGGGSGGSIWEGLGGLLLGLGDSRAYVRAHGVGGCLPFLRGGLLLCLGLFILHF